MNDIHEIPSIIASCNCMTKSNLLEYHKLKCPYRLISQIHMLIDDSKKAHQWAEKNSNVEILLAKALKFKEAKPQ